MPDPSGAAKSKDLQSKWVSLANLHRTSLSILSILVLFAMVFSGTAMGQCSLSGGVGGIGRIYASSGDPRLDQVLSQELYQISNEFGVRPGFQFFDDQQGPNAFALPDALVRGWPDGTVIFGMRLLRMELAQSAMQGFSIPAIAAHEFGHIVQYSQQTRPRTSPQRELQADYLAGWYVGRRPRAWSQKTDLRQVIFSFYSKGGYDFNSPTFHGSPQQRVTAFMQGFENSQMDLDDVYEASLDFVTQRR